MRTTSSLEEEGFLQVAFAAIPRVTELIAAFPDEGRAAALEAAERHYKTAARNFGCNEAAARTCVSDVMRNLRTQVEDAILDRAGD
jgi:hypothetical protein